MGHKEKQLTNEYLKNLPNNERMFRLNAGMGWTGEIVKNKDGFLILKNPRPFIGAPKGWPDLTGWESVKITADMIGQTVAIFKFIEVKATGDLSSDQKRFKKLITSMGGIFKKLTKI